MLEIDAEYQDTLTCPYCGHPHYDSTWEKMHNMGDGDTSETYCDVCGKDFTFRLDISYFFSSEKLEV